jgi:N-acetylglucosaminyldiphosphoundecaprenol N-acetyl-beta-D-mannosaminyltransferase
MEANVPGKRVTVGGVSFDALTEDRVVQHVLGALDAGQGGRILTPNVDILRQIQRSTEAREILDDSSLVVADGMPVIWASRLAGTPLPGRVSGSDLIWSLSRGLAQAGGSVFVLGGEPALLADELDWVDGTAPEPAGGRHAAGVPRSAPAQRRAARIRATADGAERAASILRRKCPGLEIAGAISPPYGFDGDPAALSRICAEIVAARPDLILVGIGFPRQERLIDALRAELPRSWFLGCGMAIGFVAGDQQRAPVWMRRTGIEWLHRLASEPTRLADRYLRHDLPFALGLLARTAVARWRTKDSGTAGRVEVRRARHRR